MLWERFWLPSYELAGYQMISSQEFVIEPLRKRKDFLAMRAGKYHHSNSMLLQMRKRSSNSSTDATRIGFTVTRKIGNAVVRNRVKRRLREVARILIPEYGHRAHDYVLIGKTGALSVKFESLQDEFVAALKRLHKNSSNSGKPNG